MCTCLCIDVCFSFGYIPRSGLVGSCDRCKAVPHKWLYYFTFPSTLYESSTSCSSLSTMYVQPFKIFSHTDRYEAIAHCGFKFPLKT